MIKYATFKFNSKSLFWGGPRFFDGIPLHIPIVWEMLVYRVIIKR
jgi:hypothetical protein